MNYRWKFWVISVLVLWLLAHVPGILYGTHALPLHQSYIGDEQSSVNGALHILEDRNLLSLGDSGVLYYGPVFSLFAIPPVVADFGTKYIFGVARSALEYRDHILYDWGGIVLWIHIEAVLLSALALAVFWHILRRENDSVWPPVLATALLGLNYYFFEYSHFFKHWIVVIPALLIQFATMLGLQRSPRRTLYWALHAIAALVGAGVSYISLFSMVMWLPFLWDWWRARQWDAFRPFVLMNAGILLGFALIILWYPHAFVRLLGFTSLGAGGIPPAADWTTGGASFGYYLTLILLNHAAYVAATLAMVVAGGARILKDKIIASATLVALVNFMFFAPLEHHEGRYMLVPVVFLLLAFGRLLVLYAASAKRRYAPLISVLLVFGMFFHTVSIGGWIYQYAKGPQEQTILKELENRPEPILVIDSYILGIPHTREAYQAYAAQTGKMEVNLYKALFETEPQGVKAYDIYYASYDEVMADPKSIMRRYPTVIQQFEPLRKKELNQFDFVDEDIARIWYADALLPTYRIW